MSKRALYKESSEDPLGSKLYLTSYRVLRHAEQALAEFNISFHSYLALYYIEKIPRISMRELCEYLDVSQSIISRTVQTLQKKGLIRRAPASDKRKCELALTGEARKRLKKASGKLHELTFLIRHQPDFRIAEIDAQLERIQKGVSVAKSRPILKQETNNEPGESILVRLGKRVGVSS